MLMIFGNAGQHLGDTNYWKSEHAKRGLCLVSANAGALRLLVPKAAEHFLPEMRTGASVTIEPSISSAGNIDLVFEDGTHSPFFLAISPSMFDRHLQEGRNIPFSVWTEDGMVMQIPCKVTGAAAKLYKRAQGKR